MTALEHISLQTVSGVGWLKFARAPINAFNRQMLDEVEAALTGLAADPAVRVIALGSTIATHFSTGADLKGFQTATAAEMADWVATCHRVARLLRGGDKPVIAAINGVAVGGGLEISLHADLRFAGEGARFGQPEINIAFIPPVAGTQALVRLIGRGPAMRMLYDGQMMSAEDALKIGLVDEVAPAEALEARVQSYGESLAARPANALAAIRRCLIGAADLPFDDGMAVEEHQATRLAEHPNFREGIAAFLEKRPARWT